MASMRRLGEGGRSRDDGHRGCAAGFAFDLVVFEVLFDDGTSMQQYRTDAH